MSKTQEDGRELHSHRCNRDCVERRLWTSKASNLGVSPEREHAMPVQLHNTELGEFEDRSRIIAGLP